LVNPDVRLVCRTVVFLKPDVLLLFDRIRLGKEKLKVQLRFQVYNGDEKGSAEIADGVFRIKRPLATLQGTTSASTPFVARTGLHPVTKDIGVYPYIETEMENALDHKIVTVMTAQMGGKGHGAVDVSYAGATCAVKTNHNGRSRTVTINTDEELPTVAIS